MSRIDHDVLYLSPEKRDELTDRIANEVYAVVRACGEDMNHIASSQILSMEMLGRDIFDRALKKFYRQVA